MTEPLLVELNRETADLLGHRADMTRRDPAEEAAILLEQTLETWQMQSALRNAYLRRLATGQVRPQMARAPRAPDAACDALAPNRRPHLSSRVT